MSALIQAQHLHRYYADTHAVNDVSIELHQGDILGLLGTNGAGKSSCMQMLSGVLAPDAGEITINGFDLLEQPKQAKQHIGYLPDKPPLYPELTVNEYLDYAAILRRVSRSDVTDLREQAKQRCGLTSHGDQLISNLSKGYQQRVGIAQAIIHQPRVIILDEPTVGLDPIQMREIRHLIKQLGEQHGIILSTHILPEVQAVCNKVQIINQGKKVFSGNMESLNQQMLSDTMIVSFAHPVSAEQINQVAGIIEVSEISPQQFRLHIDTPDSSIDKLLRTSLDNEWGLQELTPEKQTLESVFVKLTSADIAGTTVSEDSP